jgi:hypothetical protein
MLFSLTFPFINDPISNAKIVAYLEESLLFDGSAAVGEEVLRYLC